MRDPIRGLFGGVALALALGASPASAAGMAFDPAAAAKAYWDKVLVHCGDGFYRYYDQSEIMEYQDPVNLHLEEEKLTPADLEYHLQWKGRATISAAKSRTRGANDNLHILGDWSAFIDGGDESVAITVYGGKVLYDGVELGQVHRAISCAEVMAPTAPELTPKPPKPAPAPATAATPPAR